MTELWENDPAWREFVANVRRDTLEKMTDSACVISIMPSPDDVDIKFAVELGLGIMLDKPLLLLVQPGATIPDRLGRVADEIVEADVDTEHGQKLIKSALLGLLEGSG